MLTRLKVSGFKNLVDVDVRLGPFTCIAGPNGVGKSNVFDAILFLSALADRTLVEAAASVRAGAERSGDVRGIFHRFGGVCDREMHFEAEMVLPRRGLDELGQPVEASISLVRYVLRLGIREPGRSDPDAGPLVVLQETLAPLRLREAAEHLAFPHRKAWRDSVLEGRRAADFISTEVQGGQPVVQMHQDGRSGRLLTRPAASLPRTFLSTVQTGEYPTALLARREMQSWRMLQLEGSALRRPDPFTAPSRLGPDGSHLAATLYHLGRRGADKGSDPDRNRPAAVYTRVANRLSELLDDVREVAVLRDEARERFTAQIKLRDGTLHPARDLSDGTLRFLALAVLEFDTQSGGLLCLEEPENGIHPRRIPAMLELLQDIATDVDEPVDEDNPLRQVIVNTHSPGVLQQVPEDSILMAELVEDVRLPAGSPAQLVEPIRFQKLRFSGLGGTWRTRAGSGTAVAKLGDLLAYLNAPALVREDRLTRRRVMDRPEVQPMLPHFPTP